MRVPEGSLQWLDVCACRALDLRMRLCDTMGISEIQAGARICHSIFLESS
jgi:hypothetical protein